LTQHHRQTHVAWATTCLRWTQRLLNADLFTYEFCFHVDFVDGPACVRRGRIEQQHPENVIQDDHYCGTYSGVTIVDKIDHPRQSEWNSKLTVLL
jgi:hypothetical protein